MSGEYRLYRTPADASADRPSPVNRAAALLAQRRHRLTVLGRHRELVADAGWDVMLMLFVAAGHGERMSVERLVDEIGAPRPVLERWLAALRAKGLATRSAADGPAEDDGDADIRLTAAGSAMLESYLREV